MYTGQWVEGMQEGVGKLTLFSGNVYDGQWKANKRHGRGLYKVAKPTAAGLAVYEGEWVEDVRCGVGTIRGYDGHLEVSRFCCDCHGFSVRPHGPLATEVPAVQPQSRRTSSHR